MVNGTTWLLTGHFPASAQVVSWLVFFLVNGLLLLNQLPDIEADRAVGRKHIPVLLGVPVSVGVYGLLLVGAWLADTGFSTRRHAAGFAIGPGDTAAGRAGISCASCQ